MDLTSEQREVLLEILKARFANSANRHQGLDWDTLQAKLEAQPAKLWSLNAMERTGGEPDVVGYDEKTGEYIFYDCEGQEARKKHKPDNIDSCRRWVISIRKRRVG